MDAWATAAAVIAFFISIASFILSVAAIRHTKHVDAREQDISRESLLTDVRMGIEKLRALIPEAQVSKDRNLAAAGQYQSGYRQGWIARLDEIQNKLGEIAAQFESVQTKPSKKDGNDIKKFDLFRKQIESLISELEASLESDRHDVEERRKAQNFKRT